MLINANDRISIADYLERERWYNGFEFVAYLDGAEPNEISQLSCFQTYQEANRYCLSSSTEIDNYELLSTRSVYRVLYDAINGKQDFIYRNGAVDVKAMIIARNENVTKQVTINKGENIMETNEEILAFLQERLLYTGFGDVVDVEKLRKAINSGKEDIQLKVAAVHADGILNAVLHFKKSDKSEKYFFNKYDAELKKIGVKETNKQTFFVNNSGGTFTFKEAYNLMQGRAVHKVMNKNGTDEKYSACFEIDYSKVSDKGIYDYKRHFNIDIEKMVEKFPFKELKHPQSKEMLIKGFQKGNIQTVTFEKGKTEYTRLATLNAQFRKFDFRDPDTGRLTIESQIKVAPQKAEEKNVAGDQQLSNSSKVADSTKETHQGQIPSSSKAAEDHSQTKGSTLDAKQNEQAALKTSSEKTSENLTTNSNQVEGKKPDVTNQKKAENVGVTKGVKRVRGKKISA
ncbi:hypothetical protein [Pedobacter xixiisoli]|uniref:Uncharacterized protein n=1 Tax=Pedobacter xixiisoli TaxID=1476464 RepID=A0A286A6Z2_9SPHI|nr:hypothetical protein [Pedobacter xixiisoli]SOD17659.1 hypothetical protein SAMN06297358_2623 [Pedobacter xixiisoli]